MSMEELDAVASRELSNAELEAVVGGKGRGRGDGTGPGTGNGNGTGGGQQHP